MEKIIPTILLALFTLFSCNQRDESFEVMSFNVRLDHAGDQENQWAKRVPLVSGYLKARHPGVIGMQEVLPNQLNDLKEILSDYEFVSAGRMNGKEKGEACPVFYHRSLFELMESDHFWLSETPDVPGSMSWDTHYPRIVSWVKLKSISSGYPFFVFNTHFSHISEEARKKSAEMLLNQINEIAGTAAVILTGDFNALRESATYNRLTTGGNDQALLWNAEDLTKNTSGGNITYNAFDREFAGTRIDYIFVNAYFDVLEHAVDEVRDDDLFISDHYPVRAEISVRPRARERRGLQ